MTGLESDFSEIFQQFYENVSEGVHALKLFLTKGMDFRRHWIW